MEKSYRYLGYYLLLFIPLIFAAFYKSYILKFPHFDVSFDNTLHLHAFIASVWVLMLITQPFLILNKKMALHRVIGRFSYVIFPLLILSFIPGIVKIVSTGDTIYTFYPIADCLVLILLYSLSVFHKKRTPKHMRFMIGSSLVLLGPTIGRIFPRLFGFGDVATQTIMYAIIFVILTGLIFLDKKNKKDYGPYMVAVGAFFLHAAVFYVLFT